MHFLDVEEGCLTGEEDGACYAWLFVRRRPNGARKVLAVRGDTWGEVQDGIDDLLARRGNRVIRESGERIAGDAFLRGVHPGASPAMESAADAAGIMEDDGC